MKKSKQFTIFIYLISLVLITSIMIGCGKKENTPEQTKTDKKEGTSGKDSSTSKSSIDSPGKELFYMKSSVNNIACADCHSDGTNDANPLTKYFSNIQGANKRTSTFLGKFTGEEVLKNAGGATLCWESYEKNKTPLTVEQIDALNDYYGAVTKENSPSEIKYETIALPTRNKTKLKSVQNAILSLKGDPVKGEKDFESACAFCHGDKSTVKKVPHIFDDFEGNVKSIVYNVKLGDGSMPFFHTPAMSDQELADIAAYVMKRNSK